MIEHCTSEEERHIKETGELNGLIIRQVARIEMLKAGLRQLSSYAEILEGCTEDEEREIKIMIEELRAITQVLHKEKYDARVKQLFESSKNINCRDPVYIVRNRTKEEIYSEVIKLLNDLIDKYEGVKSES